MIQQYTFDGSGRQIDAQGVFFRYESASDGAGMTDLVVTIDGQNMGVFSPGDSLELPRSARRWEVKPVSSGCVGTVKIGNALIKSQKLQGVVQTIDGGRARSIAATAYMGTAYSGSSAGNYTYVQLFNKPTSDKSLVVNALTCISTAQMGFHLRGNSSAIGSVLAPGMSKKFGSPASANAELRTAFSTQLADFTSSGLRMFGGAAGGVPSTIRFTEPIILPPSFGLICHTTSTVDLGITFEWFEEAI